MRVWGFGGVGVKVQGVGYQGGSGFLAGHTNSTGRVPSDPEFSKPCLYDCLFQRSIAFVGGTCLSMSVIIGLLSRNLGEVPYYFGET